MKNRLIGYLKVFASHSVAFLPMCLVLDFGMGIQLIRDYGLLVTVLFVGAMVVYGIIFSRWLGVNRR